MLNASGLAQASAGVGSFVRCVKKERVNSLVTVIVPGFEIGCGPDGIGDEFRPTVSRNPFGISLLKLETIGKSSLNASGQYAPKCVGVPVV